MKPFRTTAYLAAALVLAACGASPPASIGPPAPAGPTVQQGPEPDMGVPAAVPLGQTVTYPDGLAVTIAVDKMFDPGQYYPQVKRGLTLVVTVTNNTGTAVPVNSIGNGPTFTLDGAQPNLIVNPGDPKAGAGSFSATVLPGKSAVYYPSVGLNASPGDLQVQWMRDYSSPPAIFTGRE